VFYLTDHYRDYPAVLVRLPAVRPELLAELLADSWARKAPKALVAKHRAGAPRTAPPRRAVPATSRRKQRPT
jgi:hypothetical protein